VWRADKGFCFNQLQQVKKNQLDRCWGENVSGNEWKDALGLTLRRTAEKGGLGEVTSQCQEKEVPLTQNEIAE
jgi:hypothetical protein